MISKSKRPTHMLATRSGARLTVILSAAKNPARTLARSFTSLRLTTRALFISLFAAATLFLTGCPSNPRNSTPDAGDLSNTSPPSVALRILVVNDPELVEVLNRIRGEWTERGGGELATTDTTWAELAKEKTIEADVVIFPSRYLGELCTRSWLRPMRASILESTDLKFADFFPLVRNQLIKWGGQTMALPLGLDPNTISPQPGQRPSLALLATAAPRAVSNERLGVLFDVETMKPRITEPPFVEALAALPEVPLFVREGLEEGSSAVEPRVPVLGYADRLIGVTASSHNAASAFKLVEWLASAETSAQFARLGGGTLPTRTSTASSPAWSPEELSAEERAKIADTLAADLSGERCLLVPRIPAIDDYLAALDDAVKSATVDKSPADETLLKTAQRWEEITTAHGRDAQRDAYQKHLGITK